jgi:hypothetical protein
VIAREHLALGALALASSLAPTRAIAQTASPPPYSPPTPQVMGPPPALPTVGDPPDPTLRLGAMPVPYLDRRALVAHRDTRLDTARFDERRALRIATASMASLGATTLSVGFGAGVVQISQGSTCPWCSFGLAVTSIVTMTAVSSFAIAGAYVLASNAFNARTSYWSAFGGWWAGAVVGGTVIATALTFGRPDLPTLFSCVALLPLIGQVIASEATARPTETRRSEAGARIVPSIYVAANGAATLSITGAL